MRPKPNLHQKHNDFPELDAGDERGRESDRARRCIVSGEVMPEDRLIRFVAAPDGSVAPDLARKLPGRGMWVEANRAAVDLAVKKNQFSRAAKAKLNPQADLSDLIERLLAKRCLEQLGLARREGALVTGFEKAHIALRSGHPAWIVEAADGSSDGRRKLFGAAGRKSDGSPGAHAAGDAEMTEDLIPVCGAFSAEELGLALGIENVIHVLLLAGRRAERWTEEVQKLAGFRPLLPESWREEARSGRGG